MKMISSQAYVHQDCLDTYGHLHDWIGFIVSTSPLYIYTKMALDILSLMGSAANETKLEAFCLLSGGLGVKQCCLHCPSSVGR